MRWDGQKLGVEDVRAARTGPLGSRPQRPDAGLRRGHVPRGHVQERAEQGARGVADAVPLDGEPDAGVPARLHLLLRPPDARVPRPRRRTRLRDADRRQDERRRRPARASSPDRRGGASTSRSAPTPTRTSGSRAGTGSCPGSSRRWSASRHAAVDPDQGHAAAPRPRAARGGVRATCRSASGSRWPSATRRCSRRSSRGPRRRARGSTSSVRSGTPGCRAASWSRPCCRG